MGPQSSENVGLMPTCAEDESLSCRLRRRTLSGSSEFIDPGGGTTGAFSSSAGKNNSNNDDVPPSFGIPIPAFLQPLLGLDFVPYLPSPDSNGQEEDLVLLRTPTKTNVAARSSSCCTTTAQQDDDEDYDDTEAELDEMDRHLNLHGTNTATTATTTTTTATPPLLGRRKKFFHRTRENRPVRKAIGKTFSAIKNGRNKQHNKDAEDVVLATATTTTDSGTSPRRASRATTPKGYKSIGSSLSDVASSSHSVTPVSLSDRQLQWTSIDQQIQSLKSLEEKAHFVSKRANTIQGQISTLTTQANELQQALAKVLEKLHHEEANLDSTEQELQSLNENFSQAARQLSASLENIHRTMPTTPSSSIPTPKTSSIESEEEEEEEAHQEDTIDRALLLRRRSYTETDGHFSAKELRYSESFDGLLLPEHRHYHHHQHDPTIMMANNRRRANTDPQPPTSVLPQSTSFMRVSDLELESSSCASSIFSFRALDDALEKRLVDGGGVGGSSDDFFSLDENIPLILCRLSELGLQVSTDESSRFSPTADTQRILQNKQCLAKDASPNWPFLPWHAAKGKDILVWTGGVDHKGFGHDWPVVKARCVVRTSPRNLLDFLMDSSQLKKYNKMSQGRENVFVLQEGVDTRPENSAYGFAGDARIMRALNKPKLLPKMIEMLSLWYTRPVPDAPNAYMTVSRSVWENSTGTPKHGNNNRLRSEMLLGVNLLRPCPEGTELTTITHVFAPGVPEIMAKRMAPQSAANMMREIQNVFS